MPPEYGKIHSIAPVTNSNKLENGLRTFVYLMRVPYKVMQQSVAEK